MKKGYLILIMFGLSVIASCKKDAIEIPESNEPVFSVSGTFNGEPLNLIAGNDGAYMHTMTKMENGVNIFSGIISNESMSFEVGVFDGNLDVQSTGAPSTNIAPIYSSVSIVPLATLSKNSFLNASVINYIKWFVDGIDRGPNDVLIYEAGVFNVCAEVHFQDGSENTLCNDIIIGFNHNATCDFETVLLGSGLVKTSIQNPTNAVSSVEWYINDVLTQTTDTFEYYLPDFLQKLTAKIHFDNGTVKTKSMLVDGYNTQKNIEDFSVFEMQSEAFTSRDFNIRVIINLGNDIYRSDLANNVSSGVQITEIKPYGLNSAGKNVYKISGIISCKQRKVGTSIDANLNVNFVFGIEIP
jgi:hypothetical protein